MLEEMRDRDLDEKTYIGGYCVSTVALRIEHHGGMWYETYIFPADGGRITDWLEVWGTRYATRDEAVAGHTQVCDDLRAGRLTTWDGQPLTTAPRSGAPKPGTPPEEGES